MRTVLKLKAPLQIRDNGTNAAVETIGVTLQVSGDRFTLQPEPWHTFEPLIRSGGWNNNPFSERIDSDPVIRDLLAQVLARAEAVITAKLDALGGAA
jgi:hypothetical protein